MGLFVSHFLSKWFLSLCLAEILLLGMYPRGCLGQDKIRSDILQDCGSQDASQEAAWVQLCCQAACVPTSLLHLVPLHSLWCQLTCGLLEETPAQSPGDCLRDPPQTTSIPEVVWNYSSEMPILCFLLTWAKLLPWPGNRHVPLYWTDPKTILTGLVPPISFPLHTLSM